MFQYYISMEDHMPTKQGSPAFLTDPVAVALLESANMARLAYTWTDGSPRVVPIWFAWDGAAIRLWSPPSAPKLIALARDSRVALTIDRNEWPVKVLLIRGVAEVDSVASDSPDYRAMATRYLGEAGASSWVAQYSQMFPQCAQITIRPAWAGIIDMETRFPSAIERAMEGA
jgi:hypothetical protein